MDGNRSAVANLLYPVLTGLNERPERGNADLSGFGYQFVGFLVEFFRATDNEFTNVLRSLRGNCQVCRVFTRGETSRDSQTQSVRVNLYIIPLQRNGLKGLGPVGPRIAGDCRLGMARCSGFHVAGLRGSAAVQPARSRHSESSSIPYGGSVTIGDGLRSSSN